MTGFKGRDDKDKKKTQDEWSGTFELVIFDDEWIEPETDSLNTAAESTAEALPTIMIIVIVGGFVTIIAVLVLISICVYKCKNETRVGGDGDQNKIAGSEKANAEKDQNKNVIHD